MAMMMMMMMTMMMIAPALGRTADQVHWRMIMYSYVGCVSLNVHATCMHTAHPTDRPKHASDTIPV